MILNFVRLFFVILWISIHNFKGIRIYLGHKPRLGMENDENTLNV